MRNALLKKVKTYMMSILMGVVVALLVITTISPVSISGVSMSPTLKSEDKLFMNCNRTNILLLEIIEIIAKTADLLAQLKKIA